MRIPFLGGSGRLRSVSVNAARTVNFYTEVSPDSKSPVAMYGTPGLVRFAETTAGEGRGLYSAMGRLFAVVGDTLYEVASDGTPTNRGTLESATGAVSIADNGLHVVVVDGTKGYKFTLGTNAFETISDVDWPAANRISFVDGYFLLNQAGTGTFWVTSLYGTDVDALDFATAEAAPDALVSLIVDHREAWLFGSESTEIWYNAGGADFPFSRLDGAFIETGCAAPHSVAKMDNAVFWLSQDKRGRGHVMRAQGYQPQIISTRAVETAIHGYGDVSDARAYTYQQEGHAFYVLTFPTANATWVYDAASNEWHERMYWDGHENRHRGADYAFCFGRHLVIDHSNGRLYEFDLDAYTDDGDEIRSIRRTQHQHAQGKRITWRELQVDVESGVGAQSGQGSDPHMMLRWSDDGGKTWSSEHWQGMGKVGEYSRRAIWRRLGQSRNRVYELTISDPVKRVVIDAWAEAEAER